MKASHKYKIGISLIVVSVILFVMAANQVISYYVFPVNSPCPAYDFTQMEPFPSDTRMAYCVSNIQTFSGTTMYGNGYLEKDEANVDIFNFRRENQALIVNGHRLHPQETYQSITWKLSTNPWLIITKDMKIRNEGLVKSNLSESDSVLNIIADVKESWLLNPLGFIIVATGTWLYLQGMKDKKQSRQALLNFHATG